jgi:hypothetical protein
MLYIFQKLCLNKLKGKLYILYCWLMFGIVFRVGIFRVSIVCHVVVIDCKKKSHQ